MMSFIVGFSISVGIDKNSFNLENAQSSCLILTLLSNRVFNLNNAACVFPDCA